jgi:hypothetical protein
MTRLLPTIVTPEPQAFLYMDHLHERTSSASTQDNIKKLIGWFHVMHHQLADLAKRVLIKWCKYVRASNFITQL